MKIYYASQSFYPHIGGVSTYLLNLAKEMVNKGNEVVEIHLRPLGEESQDEIKGIEIHRVPKEPIDKKIMKKYSKFKDAIYTESHYHQKKLTKPVYKLEGYDEFYKVNEYFCKEIKNLLEQNPPDIVHIHDFQLLFSYKFVPRGTALIFTWHVPFAENMSKFLSDFLIKHLKEYDKIIFSSQNYIDAAVKAGLPKEKAKLIYPIADTNIFKKTEVNKEEIKKEYGIPQDSKLILCVQRVDSKSGHEQLIRAMPLILKEVPNAKLVFVGGKSLSNKISKDRDMLIKNTKRLIKKLKLTRNIIWTGNIDYYKLPELYNSTDIVALCSKNEGFGLSVTEGMACGNPIIGTKVGGIPIQVENRKNGYLVNVGDYKETADKIIKILSNDKLRDKMAQKSLEIVEKNFKFEIGIEKHLMLYNGIMKIKDEFHRVEYIDKSDISAIITDLDRTITHKPAKKKFDPKDYDANLLRELKKLKIKLFLATGRTINYVRDLCKHFKIWDCVIAENGAIIYLPKTEKTISLNTPYMGRVKKIIKELKLQGTTIGQIITSNKYSDRLKIRNKIRKLSEKVKFVRNADEIIITPKGVDKGLGIRLASQYLKIDIEKTIVIGDEENDVDMFMNPGFKIALANSVPRLKKLANQVTYEPSTKGVREIISKIKEE